MDRFKLSPFQASVISASPLMGATPELVSFANCLPPSGISPRPGEILDATDCHAYPSFGGRPTGAGGRSSAGRGQTIGETSPQIFAPTSTCWRSTVG